MNNSKMWWESVKTNESKFNDWLIKQYRGEVTASNRIKQFSNKYASEKNKLILSIIAGQERTHASWILELLHSRNIMPDISNAEERYWKETLPEIESFETGAAVGAHAEAMRLERIKVICEDDSAPTDVRSVFKKILHDELFHERAFKSMAGEEAMNKTKDAHIRGKELLGLEA